jgi:hypothetical protein
VSTAKSAPLVCCKKLLESTLENLSYAEPQIEEFDAGQHALMLDVVGTARTNVEAALRWLKKARV